LVWVKFRLHS